MWRSKKFKSKLSNLHIFCPFFWKILQFSLFIYSVSNTFSWKVICKSLMRFCTWMAYPLLRDFGKKKRLHGTLKLSIFTPFCSLIQNLQKKKLIYHFSFEPEFFSKNLNPFFVWKTRKHLSNFCWIINSEKIELYIFFHGIMSLKTLFRVRRFQEVSHTFHNVTSSNDEEL